MSQEEVRIVLQSHSEGTSLRGIGRISGLSYNTGVSLIRAASQKAQLVHNAQVSSVDPDAIAASEMWSCVEKNIYLCLSDELEIGDCWLAMSLAQLSGLILCGRVGKHTDSLAIELVTSTEGKNESHLALDYQLL